MHRMRVSVSSNDCPVCYSPCKVTTDVQDFYICEQYIACSHGCYAYEFSYGSYRVHIQIRGHNVEFYWHYSDPSGDSRPRNEAIEVVTLAARKALLEDLLNPKDECEDSKATTR